MNKIIDYYINNLNNYKNTKSIIIKKINKKEERLVDYTQWSVYSEVSFKIFNKYNNLLSNTNNEIINISNKQLSIIRIYFKR